MLDLHYSIKLRQSKVDITGLHHARLIPEAYHTWSVGHSPLHIPPSDIPPPDNFSPHLSPPAVEAEIWKLALTYIPDHIAINVVHINSRSLYTVDWRMVGGGGRGKCPGGICPGEMSRSPYMCQQAAGHPDVVGDTVYTTTILRPVLLLEMTARVRPAIYPKICSCQNPFLHNPPYFRAWGLAQVMPACIPWGRG